MNTNDFIEEKKREYLKTEACEWDCHEFCELMVKVGTITSPCLCKCHDILGDGELLRDTITI